MPEFTLPASRIVAIWVEVSGYLYECQLFLLTFCPPDIFVWYMTVS